MLVVDDDAVSLEVVAAMLAADGHEIFRAADREQALRLLAASGPDSGRIDTVFVDLLMPGLPDAEFAARIRALPVHIPRLVAMSATPADPGKRSSFDRFLLKPATMESLRAAIAGADSPRRRPERKRYNSQGAPSTASANGLEDCIDAGVLRKLREMMPPESLQELYRACVDDSRIRISALRELAQSDRVDQIRPGAHQIKGAAAMVGASHLASLAASLELGSYDHEDSLRRLNEMEAECGRIERMLLGEELES